MRKEFLPSFKKASMLFLGSLITFILTFIVVYSTDTIRASSIKYTTANLMINLSWGLMVLAAIFILVSIVSILKLRQSKLVIDKDGIYDEIKSPKTFVKWSEIKAIREDRIVDLVKIIVIELYEPEKYIQQYSYSRWSKTDREYNMSQFGSYFILSVNQLKPGHSEIFEMIKEYHQKYTLKFGLR